MRFMDMEYAHMSTMVLAVLAFHEAQRIVELDCHGAYLSGFEERELEERKQRLCHIDMALRIRESSVRRMLAERPNKAEC